MTNTTLTAGTLLTHSAWGLGRIISLYDDGGIDMVEVHWAQGNIVEDVREESLRIGLTRIVEGSKKSNLWAKLASEEK